MKRKEYYFAYFIPEQDVSGVVKCWEECQEQIVGKKSAKYKKFMSHTEALDFIQEQIIAFNNQESTSVRSTKKNMEIKNKIPLDTEALFFDSGTGRGAGIEISVTDYTGKSKLYTLAEDGFFENPLTSWGSYIFSKELNYTNNFGELFAFSCALKIAKKEKYLKIFGDSKLVINYWSLGYMNAPKLNKETVILIKQVIVERKEFELSGGVVAFIEGEENPADMGFHK